MEIILLKYKLTICLPALYTKVYIQGVLMHILYGSTRAPYDRISEDELNAVFLDVMNDRLNQDNEQPATAPVIQNINVLPPCLP
jgi:hypothetical protein